MTQYSCAKIPDTLFIKYPCCRQLERSLSQENASLHKREDQSSKLSTHLKARRCSVHACNPTAEERRRGRQEAPALAQQAVSELQIW